ncbi:MAG: hypothetical protein MUF65_10335 [Rubritepida sp.]|jgi:hypothetical protein|nr:hypothetical protein [Rubritepida sp.]
MRTLALLALLALAACGTPGGGTNIDNLPGTPYPDAINPRGYMLNDGTLILFRDLPPGTRGR